MGSRRAPGAIEGLASRQHGNVTVAQLVEAGLTRHEIATRVARGWLLPRHRGVYALGHVPATRPSRWHAGVLALGDGAVLSHRAAAAHWSILRGAVPTEVTIPSRSGRAHRDDIVVHRSLLPPEHTTMRHGIPVTTLLRTVLDAATVLRLRWLREVFEEAQVQFTLQPEVVAAEALCRRGFRGNGKVWQILQDAVDPAGVRSILELRFLRMCAAHGVPRPVVNERIGRWTVDFLWPQVGLVVETDGDRFHRTKAKRERDARKDEFLRSIGLTVVRLIWADVTERAALTAGSLIRHLGEGQDRPRQAAQTDPHRSGAGATRRPGRPGR